MKTDCRKCVHFYSVMTGDNGTGYNPSPCCRLYEDTGERPNPIEKTCFSKKLNKEVKIQSSYSTVQAAVMVGKALDIIDRRIEIEGGVYDKEKTTYRLLGILKRDGEERLYEYARTAKIHKEEKK